ncbi:hypothetical protein EMPS_04642 [Entomortierella parvispora]|uniref:Dienelactone hydrolase domain-containing protein n=1 Tax=Entomortierella parvispora TaxID=205924 RepID=A0A9P3H8X0_9FUNG|nr:hypothetical protein EMPS_04642 [Entomortierella parvispora]
MSGLTDSCCNTPATETVWAKKGEEKILHVANHEQHEHKTYRTGPKTATTGIIGVYDVMGYHPTGIQFFDRLAVAHGGFQVSVPNFFYKTNKVPPELFGDRPKLMEWLGANGSYGAPSHVDSVIHAAVEDLRKDGCTHFVIYGQCWGALKALEAAADEKMPFLAAGGPHPSMMTEELMKNARCPVILLPAKDDPDMVPLVAIANEKNTKIKSEQHRFPTVQHGWTGGRGDWSNPEQKKCAEEAIHLLATFTNKVVEASKA